MAKIEHMGPYEKSDVLAPGKGVWIDFGESKKFANCALSITATPRSGRDGNTHVLKVENVNISRVISHNGDITYDSYHAGCSIINNGKTTITKWSVMVGVITP